MITAVYEEPQNRFVIQVEETPPLWKTESKRVRFEVSCYDHVEPLHVLQPGERTELSRSQNRPCLATLIRRAGSGSALGRPRTSSLRVVPKGVKSAE